MSETMLKYQCSKCLAPLEFNIEKQKLVCEFCQSEFDEEIFKNSNENKSEEMLNGEEEHIEWDVLDTNRDEETEDSLGFLCTSCGAEVVSTGETIATECMYCGNPVVMADNIKGMLKPDLIIPFKIEKDKAEEMLKDFYKGKILLPNSFKDANRISKISGIYVPFWLFTCQGNGDAIFKATKEKSWRSGNYRYTKTDIYNAYRKGDMRFEKIPVDASIKMDDNFMDGLEPYNYDELCEFSPMYMASYFGDKFDVSVEESTNRANTRVIESFKESLRRTVNGYKSVSVLHSNIKVSGEDVKYALLPVWMLNTTYEGKVYQFAINGQTGRVSGELPVDRKKKMMLQIGITLGGMLPISYVIYKIMELM